jgi:uncharacterized protein (TIGR00290 family)
MKVTISWSGGKDSAFALYKVLQSGEHEVSGLHTVINEKTSRVGMHGVREDIIDDQADKIGLPLTKLYLESSESHDAYNALIKNYYEHCVQNEIKGVVFGDIFLEDLRQFRERMLTEAGLIGMYPLWKIDTREVMHDFLQNGFRTAVCAANAKFFSEVELGKTIDWDFINQLPKEVDPCGENGEFHTLVYDGPIFIKRLEFERGETVKKSYSFNVTNNLGITERLESQFWFQDFISPK